jgi:subtilase family serine protease
MLSSLQQWRSLYHRAFLSTLGLFLLFIPLMSCATPTSASNPLQATPLNPGIPANALNSPVTGQLPGNTTLHIRITFKLNQQKMQQAQQQPVRAGQPSHVEQAANSLGISDATYQKIKSFFSLRNIELSLSKLHTQLSINAQASTVAKVLHTSFVVHSYQGRIFYAPDSHKVPTVPQFLANIIDAVTGLDNYSRPPTHQFSFQPLSNTTATTHNNARDCYAPDQTLIPTDVAHSYGFDRLWQQGWHGENMTVNLVEIDGSYQSDIQTYFDCIGFKGHLQPIDVDGHPQQVLGESTLDIQMAAGLAPSSTIKVYQTDSSDSSSDIWVNVNDELQQILNDNTNNANSGNVVSISLGLAEDQISSDDVRAIHSSLQQLAQVEHMMVFVASGDCGAFGDEVFNQLAVSYPATDPWVTAVGGTILQVDQNSNRTNETVWSDGSDPAKCQNSWGSGGGNSTLFKRASWQNAPGVNNRYSHGDRQVPDVSAVAYALAVYYNGQWGAVGGTSAAAPIWATGMALVHQGLLQKKHTFNTDDSAHIFYQLAGNNQTRNALFDITQGNNLYYPATSGWDFSSGLGTPNMYNLYQAIQSTLR